MKTFSQLTKEQQNKAVERQTNLILEDIVDGFRFNDKASGNDLQKRIDAAFAKAEKMRTPWFSHEYVMDTCREEVESFGRASAENALYAEPEEQVVSGII